MSSVYLLAPFERYMLADDTARYPMTCHIRFWFDGEIIRSHFEDSLILALMRHPFLTSQIHKSGFLGFRKWSFYPVEPIVQEIVEWKAFRDSFNLRPQHAPDLRTRFLIRCGEGKSELIIQFHHSVCDGIGVFQFFEDLFSSYHEKLTGQSQPLKPLDVNLLSRRTSFGLSKKDWLQRWPLDRRRICNFWKTLAHPIPSKKFLGGAADLAAVERLVLTRAETEQLQQIAKQQKVTLNDFLLLGFYRTIEQIHKANNHSKVKTIRIGVPTSIRTPEDERAPAANFISMVFLDRRTSELTDTNTALNSLSMEMTQVKNDRMGVTLLRLLAWFSKVPGGLRTLVRVPLCMASGVLTNLGRPFQTSRLMHEDGFVRTGNLTLTGLDTMPPVRFGTGASLSVNGYGGRLSLTLRFDSRKFSDLEAKEILKIFTSQLIKK